MPARDRKASTIDLAEDLSVLSPERAKEFLVAALEPDTRSGVLRFSKVPSVIVRPEAIVNIQRQLEQTIGGSSKGILYLSGERSARDGMNPFESIVSTRAPLTLANARRLMDASALLGWGRLEISLFDPENGRLVLAVTNSPLARAYGASKKPVCHFLTGGSRGLVRASWSARCSAKRPRAPHKAADVANSSCGRSVLPDLSEKDFYPSRFSEAGSGRPWSVLMPSSSERDPRAPRPR